MDAPPPPPHLSRRTIDFQIRLIHVSTRKKIGAGKQYPLKPLGDAGPVINAGGLFPYAIKTGMIQKLDE